MNDFPAEYVALIGGCAVKEDGDATEYCFGPVNLVQRLTRCRECIHWFTPVAFSTTGVCALSKRVRSAEFFCGDGTPRDREG